MKFGPVAVDQALGAILAHAVETASGRLKKGKFITEADLEALRSNGVSELIVARLEPGDIEENLAAERIGGALAISEVFAETAFTGRVNLFAENSGILVVDAGLINEINRIDPGITVATLPEYAPVEAGRMVATIKVIPFAVRLASVEAVISLIAGSTVLELKSYQSKRVGLIATCLPSLKLATMDKTRRILEARLRPSKSEIVDEQRVAHNADAIAAAIETIQDNCDLLILFGASATIDPQDVIPAGLRLAGGKVEHFGMPVDPGNLLVLGRLGGLPVIGAPGCARSPSENGFDWVLQRVLADIPVSAQEIQSMGTGGLLMEIHSRPQPRQVGPEFSDNIHAIILAAGQSRRMGIANKLLATLDGKPLVRRVVEAALASDVTGVKVVTGHQSKSVESTLGGLDIEFCHNAEFAGGLASSLRIGIAALPVDCSGALILLADMPHITGELINRILADFRKAPQGAIIQATGHGKRGNPVLWSALYFDALKNISGDVGARHLIGQNAEHVIEVELGEAAAVDIDTPDALRAQGGMLSGD